MTTEISQPSILNIIKTIINDNDKNITMNIECDNFNHKLILENNQLFFYQKSIKEDLIEDVKEVIKEDLIEDVKEVIKECIKEDIKEVIKEDVKEGSITSIFNKTVHMIDSERVDINKKALLSLNTLIPPIYGSDLSNIYYYNTRADYNITKLTNIKYFIEDEMLFHHPGHDNDIILYNLDQSKLIYLYKLIELLQSISNKNRTFLLEIKNNKSVSKSWCFKYLNEYNETKKIVNKSFTFNIEKCWKEYICTDIKDFYFK